MCQSRLHTTSETFVQHKKFRSGLIFCIFASVASILIEKDDEYKKKCIQKMSDSVCKDLKAYKNLQTQSSTKDRDSCALKILESGLMWHWNTRIQPDTTVRSREDSWFLPLWALRSKTHQKTSTHLLCDVTTNVSSNAQGWNMHMWSLSDAQISETYDYILHLYSTKIKWWDFAKKKNENLKRQKHIVFVT